MPTPSLKSLIDVWFDRNYQMSSLFVKTVTNSVRFGQIYKIDEDRILDERPLLIWKANFSSEIVGDSTIS